MDSLPVTLIVKAPNQQYEDQTIKCELTWSIRKLKGYLSEVYPCNPSLDEQKLIYSGQLLNDAHILKDVLRQYEGQETHTVHLVFTPKNHKYPSLIQKKETNPTPKTKPPPVINSSTNSTATDAGLRQRNVPQQTASTPIVQPTQAQYGVTGGPQLNTQYNPQQYAFAQHLAMQNMMHQMYLQYLNHYARASQPPTSSGQVGDGFPNGYPYAPPNLVNGQFPTPMMPPPQLQPHQAAVGQYHNVYEAAAQPEPQAQPRAPAAAIDDDVENRDWLDILYTFSRLIVLLSLVYFYSSPGRCSVVILVMVLYYFYQNHQRNVRERQALEMQQAAAANAQPNEQPQNDDGQTENAQDEENADNATENGPETVNENLDENDANPLTSSSTATTTQTAEIEDTTRLPTTALLRTFVLSFFASLIPETPAV